VRRTYGRIRSAAWRTSAAWSWMKLVKPRGVAVGRGLAGRRAGQIGEHGACEDDGHAMTIGSSKSHLAAQCPEHRRHRDEQGDARRAHCTSVFIT